MRGKEGYITGQSNVISRSFFFQPSSSSSPQCPKTKDAEKKGKRYRGMKREEEGGSVFPSILNNGGMICAYPLITPLLYSSPPSSLLSLTPHNPSSSHLVGEGQSFPPVSLPPFFLQPLHLFVPPVQGFCWMAVIPLSPLFCVVSPFSFIINMCIYIFLLCFMQKLKHQFVAVIFRMKTDVTHEAHSCSLARLILNC